MYNERAQMLVEQLQQTKEGIKLWNGYADGRREAFQEAIDLVKIVFELEEVEVHHA